MIKEQSMIGVDINAQDQGAKYSSIAAESSIKGTNTLMQTINSIADQGIQFALAKRNEQEAKLNKKEIEKGILDGSLNVPDEQYVADVVEGDDPYSTAFNKSRQKVIDANIIRDFREKATAITEQNKSNPEGIKTGFKDLVRKMRMDYKLDKKGQATLDEAYRTALDTSLPRAVKSSYQEAKQNEATATNQLLNETVNVGLNEVRLGDFSNIKTLASKAEGIYNEGIERGIFSEGDKAAYINNVMLEANEQAVKGQAEKLISEGRFEEAQEAVNSWVEGSRERGEFQPDDIDRISNGVTREISQAQKAREYEAKKAVSEAIEIQKNQIKIDTVSDSLKTGVPLPKNKQSQSAVDAYYNESPNQFDTSTEQGMINTAEFISRVGIIPTELSNGLRGQMLSNDPELVTKGAVMWSAALDANPSATSQAFSKEENAFYSNVTSLTKAGLNAPDAIERAKNIAYGLDSEVNKTIKARMTRQDFEEQIYTAAQDNIDNQVSFFSSSPDINESLQGSTEYTTDYSTLYRSNYLATNGNAEQAQKLTDGEISRIYSVSEINGNNEIMKYSPESFYGDIDLLEGQWESAKEEIRKSIGHLPEDTEILIKSDLVTAQNTNNPSWLVVTKYVDSDGVEFEQPYIDSDGVMIRMTFDPKDSDQYREQQDKIQRELEKAKAARENPVDYRATANFMTKFDIKK